MQDMAESITMPFFFTAGRLMELGLGYLTLDRAAATLSTGERQRMQLARAVRNRSTGVMYVLDEPSIGLHPKNIDGLRGVIEDLKKDGNSVILVDHDTGILKSADWFIEMGPGSGENGGRIVAQGTLSDICDSAKSKIAPFLSGRAQKPVRPRTPSAEMFSLGRIHLETSGIHTVKPAAVDFPKGRLIAVTGVSGSGKTTLVLESLIPALKSIIGECVLPSHVKAIDAPGIKSVKLIDATPIGINVRSTVATYAGVHDELRKIFAKTKDAKDKGLKAGDFSYKDVDIDCPECHGTRYAKSASEIIYAPKGRKGFSLPGLMGMSISKALESVKDLKTVRDRLQILEDLGIGYLTLGEETPGLSGGEAQRLKLASEMGRGQDGAVFVFDEPTIGLHPLDVQSLIGVFQKLIESGATVIVIEHDLDFIRNADWVIDMGPGGGADGGRVIAEGTPEEIKENESSVTGKYL